MRAGHFLVGQTPPLDANPARRYTNPDAESPVGRHRWVQTPF